MPLFLREHRESAKLTRQQVADELGLKAPAIYKWENGITAPSMRDAERLSIVLGITPGRLFENPNNNTREHGEMESVTALAKALSLSVAAWVYVGEDSSRMEEAEQITGLLTIWKDLKPDQKEHWIAVGAAYADSRSRKKGKRSPP